MTVADLVDTAVWTSAAAVLWFIVQYTLSSPWWSDPVGRTIVAKDISLLFLLVPACIFLARPSAFTELQVEVIDFASLAAVTASMVWRSVVWWRVRPPSLPRRRRGPRAD